MRRFAAWTGWVVCVPACLAPPGSAPPAHDAATSFDTASLADVSLRADVRQAETGAAAAVPVDAARREPVPLDAVGVDAVPVDAVPADAVPADTLPADTLPAETAATDAAAADSAPTPDAVIPKLAASTYLLTLKNAAFPSVAGQPDALVYVPAQFAPAPPLHVVVYLHGWYNCVANVAGAKDGPCSAAPGSPLRPASQLIVQFEAAKKNALLLCPEAKFDQGSSDPGKLAGVDGFRKLVQEVLAKLPPPLDKLGPADLGRVIVVSHSGGYLAAAGIATKGGVPVHDIMLLDSLYGGAGDFAAWLQADKASFAPWPSARRFANVYTQGGGTLALAQQQANAV
ncbi:MAG: hypothetical protein EXR79_05350, partial [Myxococcales bacterium]|nr:hypothetical protein [Myxococcales bacterium]